MIQEAVYSDFKIFDNITDIAYVVDSSKTIIYGNSQFIATYGLKSFDILEKKVREIHNDSNLLQAIDVKLRSQNKDEVSIKISALGDERILTLNNWDFYTQEPLCLIMEKIPEEANFNQMRSNEGCIEETFFSLFNHMKEGLTMYRVLFDKDNNPIDLEFAAINAAYKKLTGYKSNELIGKTYLQQFPNTDQNWMNHHFNAFRFQRPFSFEHHFAEIGKYWEVRTIPASENMVASIVQDITPQKIKEQELNNSYRNLKETKEKLNAYNEQLRFSCEQIKISELGYKTLFNKTNDAILILKEDIIIDCNNGFTHLFEYTLEDIQGMPIRTLIFDRANENNGFSQVNLPDTDEIKFQQILLTKSGRQLQTLIALSNYEFDQTTFKYLIIKDVTAENYFRNQIQENQFQLQQTQKYANLGYWSFELGNTESMEWSSEIFNILDTDKTLSFFDFFIVYTHDEDYTRIHSSVNNFKKKPFDFDLQFKILTPKNRVKYIRKKGQLIYEDGKSYCKGIIQDITDIKLKEDLLKQTEHRFEIVLENMPVLLFAVDSNGVILFWNKECERVTGYLSSEICHSENAYQKVFSKVDFARLQIKSNNEIFRNYETSVNCIANGKATIMWSGFSKEYPIPTWHHWLVGVDITRKKENEKELKTQKDFLDKLIDNLPLMVFVKEPPEFTYTLANKRFIQFMDKSVDDVLGKTDKELDLASSEQRRSFDLEVMQANKPIQRIVQSYDKQKVFDTIKVPIIQDKNKQLLLGIAQDITDRYEQDKKILFESNVNESLAKASTELIAPSLSIDRIVRIIFNSGIELTGCSAGYVAFDDPQSQKILIHSFFKYENTQKVKSTFSFAGKKQFAEEGIYGYKIDLTKPCYRNNVAIKQKKKNGWDHQITIRNFLSCPVLVHGEIMGHIVLINSVDGFTSDQMKAIKGLSNIYSLAILRKQMEWDLISAKEKAEESDRLKSAFLANMSHEIRTPMNAIIGFSQLLIKSDPPPHKKEEFYQLINTSCDNLLLIVSDIIDISKIEAGQLQVFIKEFDLNQLIEEAYNQILKRSKQKKFYIPIHLENQIANEFIIKSDKNRVKQVLLNLLDNAIKFTPQGEVRFGYKIQDKHKIRFEVRDTGIGIPLRNQKDIFKSFYQTEETIKRTYGGNGLGLTISKKIIEQLHGEIGLSSTPGKGSTFWFEIPIL